jgi:hypothetical protein
MDVLQLNFGEWELVVDLDGGRISSLRNKGILILGSFGRIDGKKGNTHVCVPNFFNDGVEKYGLPSHGPFRNATWVLVQQTENLLEISCEIENLDVRQIFSFNNEYFNQKITVENKGENSKPVNVAIHNYWSSELGWQGSTLNGLDLSLGIKQSDFVNLQSLNNVDIPGKPLIKWLLTGFNYAKLWTGFLEESGNKIFDNSYVCIEPIVEKDENFFGSEESMLLPNTKIELRQMIGVAEIKR